MYFIPLKPICNRLGFCKLALITKKNQFRAGCGSLT